MASSATEPALAVFDLDGTLDHVALRDVLLALHASGLFRVVVLSGSHIGRPNSNPEWKRTQLRFLGVPDGVPLVLARGETEPEIAAEKARWLQDNGAALFLDDRAEFVRAALATAGACVALHVAGPPVTRSHAILRGQGLREPTA